MSILKQKSDSLQEKLIREGNSITLEELKDLKSKRDKLKDEAKAIKNGLKKLLDLVPLVFAEKHLKRLKEQLESERILLSGIIDEKLIEKEIIVFRPLAYMRGDTFDNCLMILDEAQNATFKQLMLFITRMGKGSKVIVTGDVSQYDIAKQHVGLPSFIDLMRGIKGIAEHKFTESDIVRAKILQELVGRYERWKSENE